ncbi:MAG: hypothetical protein ACVCEJ_05910 [Candidatus Izemoplasmataceae bacterium]|mgnify:CR=1 FL=1
MKLDFKGIITKDALEKDISNLDEIMNENDYAIVVENGVGKFVIFDMDYVKYKLELKDESKSRNKLKKSPFTLVESMIQTLEEIPEKKTTAIKLSSLVEKYYGRTASPVTIRTRAEENANDVGEYNYFVIEPGNIIGLADNSSFNIYMFNKMRRAIEYELHKMFKDETQIELNTVLYKINRIVKSTTYQKYSSNLTNKDIIKMISNMNNYCIDNNYVGINK